MIDEAVDADKPFVVAAAPIGPHAVTKFLPEGAIFRPPVPAPRHRNLFKDVQVPRGYNFNPDTVRHILSLINLTNTQWLRPQTQSYICS